MINESIAKLVKYGENAGLVSGLDKIYATNRILEVMQISDYEEPEQIPENPDLEETLNELLDDAAKRGLLEHNSVVYRDLFDTKLMDCLMPRPGEVVKKFEELYAKSPQEATDYFYKLSQDSNYIRRYRIAKDIRWSVPSAYGDIDISINLSKPEKDPKAIAAAKLAKQAEITTRALDLRGLFGAIGTMRQGLSPYLAVQIGIVNKCFDLFEKEIVRDVVRTRIPEEWTPQDVF